jgi:hypothetical protein
MELYLTADLMENHRRFIEESIANKEVWSIQIEGKPLLYQSSNDSSNFIVPLWSEKLYAAYHCKKEKSAGEGMPFSIKLDSFISHDLYSFYKESLLVGTNWNADLAGYEIDPLQLGDEFIKAIQPQAKINLDRYKKLTECHALIYQLSQSLAYHVIETEFTLPYAPEPAKSFLQTEVVKGKVLIHDAGFNMDELYPPERRPQVEDDKN